MTTEQSGHGTDGQLQTGRIAPTRPATEMFGDGPDRHGLMGQTAERAAGRTGNSRTITGATGGLDEAGERPKSGRSGRTAPKQRPPDRTTPDDEEMTKTVGYRDTSNKVS